VFDGQAARTGAVTVQSDRGYDPARRVTGHRRHALTNTDWDCPGLDTAGELGESV